MPSRFPLLLTLLLLSGLLLAASTAHALPTVPPLGPLGLEDEGEAEEELTPSEVACAEAQAEYERDELSEAEVEEICAEDEAGEGNDANASRAPEECRLRSARARVVAYEARNRVRLTVGYTTYVPTMATVDYRLAGGRGSLHLGTARRRLGRSGVIRLTRRLSDGQMEKVQAAGRFTVRLRVSGAPRSCRRYESEELTVRRGSDRQAVWSERR
jgi:hypothetical protein